MSKLNNKSFRYLLVSILLLGAVYGIGRLYYQVTGGFTEGNIASNYSYDPRWDVAPLTPEKKDEVQTILSQPFHYLGKGCQSYVFVSEDGHYVIKFFKYQRFRPQAWLDYLTFLPYVEDYRLRKIAKKKNKLENVYSSWKIAYEKLQPETGVIYVHLNKSDDWKLSLLAYDKMGLTHHLDIDEHEFLVQKRAEMLCPTIDRLMAEGKSTEAQLLLDRLLAMILSEYNRGYADNDHALMQNTGVYNGYPVHIDVGQFIYNPLVKDPKVYHQELFSKMFKFRLWLEKKYPDLKKHLDTKLYELMGDKLQTLKPELNKASMGRIPNV